MADSLHKYRCVIEEEKTDMARPRRQFQGSLSPGQAHYVLDRLIKDRRVSATEIARYVSEMGREISDLEARLARLRDAAGPAAAAAVAGLAAGVAGAAAVRRGRKPGRPGRPPGRPPGRRGRPPASASAAASAEGGAAPAKRGRKARAAITPEQLASRQLQGRYLALVRRFPANKRPQYAKIAKDKGREAAIREMQDAMKK
ncbi:MAG TPA: hypothetical protein VF432_28605 [Thermoanaerobaculia bacterium]